MAAFLARNGVPALNMFFYSPATHGQSVGPDNHKALYNLTTYLIGLGHTRFGVIAQDIATNDRARARAQGIRDALAEHGLAVRPEHYVTATWTIREGRALFRQVADRPARPTAIICGNGYLAVGALLESQAMGIDVPGEMSIVGYDDIEIMTELPIPITTVRVHSEEVGRRAAAHVISVIEGEQADTDFECDAEIIIRASSGPPPPRP
jgi:LacI family transcriptional regulator